MISSSFMKRIENILDSWMVPFRKINYCLIIFLFSIQVLIVFSQVIWRFVFDDPFSWSEELARYLQVWLIMLTSSVCIQKSKHLAIDYLTHKFSFKLQRLFKLTSLVGISIYTLIVIVFGLKLILIVGAQKTPALQIPIGWVYFAFPIAGLHMFFESLIVMIKVANASSIKELNKIHVLTE
jgi:TRAP-type C4-dicarboxylate transport system permease small subunit